MNSLLKRATQFTTAPLHSLRTFHSHLTSSFLRPPHQSHFSTVSVHRNIADHHRRVLAAKYELRRKLYKALTKDPELSTEMRGKHRYKLSKLPRNSSFTRIRNRCVMTGRARGVYQLFRMSRICFRDLANKGELKGITKASW
nr:mitochondrial ribosomal protein S14 [Dystaenia ibukiensis]